MVKVLPRPASLSTVTSPPIIRQSRRLSARPRPVPPYLRVVAASAWEKASKSRASCSGVMPMPVSLTRNTIQSCPSLASRATASEIVPSIGELAGVAQEVEEGLAHLRQVRPHRPRHRPGSAAPGGSRSSRPAAGSTAAMSRTRPATSKLSRYSSILPASILERSRISLISSSRCLPAALILLRSSVNCLGPQVVGVLLEHLAVADDGVERRAQLVATCWPGTRTCGDRRPRAGGSCPRSPGTAARSGWPGPTGPQRS